MPKGLWHSWVEKINNIAFLPLYKTLAEIYYEFNEFTTHDDPMTGKADKLIYNSLFLGCLNQ